MNAATIILKHGPQALDALERALQVLSNNGTVKQVADAVTTGAETIASATTIDGGVAQTVHTVRQSLRGEVLPHLDALIAAGVETPALRELHTFLSQSGSDLTHEHIPQLTHIVEQVRATNATEQLTTATEQATTQQATREESTNNAGSNDDTAVVLKNLLALINTKLTKKNGHFYMFLKWVGPLLKPIGIKVPTPDELPTIVEKYITKNEQFTNALTACIENREVDTSKMSWWQKWTFSGCKKLLKHLANNSERVLEGAPQAAYALKYGAGAIIPILGRIPVIGGLLSLAFPFVVDELNSAGEVTEKGYLKAILERLVKYHGKNSEATAPTQTPPVAATAAV